VLERRISRTATIPQCFSLPRDSLNLFRSFRSHETIPSADEAIFPAHEEGLKRKPGTNLSDNQTRGTVMRTLISFLYREYCRARLVEMRKHHLAGT
jgi:hypothetical protein